MRNPAGWGGSQAKKGDVLLKEQGWSDLARVCLPVRISARGERRNEGKQERTHESEKMMWEEMPYMEKRRKETCGAEKNHGSVVQTRTTYQMPGSSSSHLKKKKAATWGRRRQTILLLSFLGGC